MKAIQFTPEPRPIVGDPATPVPSTQTLVNSDHTLLTEARESCFGLTWIQPSLAGWLTSRAGGALRERLPRNVFASDHLFADDTLVPVLDPAAERKSELGQRNSVVVSLETKPRRSRT